MSDMDGYLDPDERCVRHGLPHPCGDCDAEQQADGWREPQDTTEAVRQAFAALLARIEARQRQQDEELGSALADRFQKGA